MITWLLATLDNCYPKATIFIVEEIKIQVPWQHVLRGTRISVPPTKLKERRNIFETYKIEVWWKYLCPTFNEPYESLLIFFNSKPTRGSDIYRQMSIFKKLSSQKSSPIIFYHYGHKHWLWQSSILNWLAKLTEVLFIDLFSHIKIMKLIIFKRFRNPVINKFTCTMWKRSCFFFAGFPTVDPHTTKIGKGLQSCDESRSVRAVKMVITSRKLDIDTLDLDGSNTFILFKGTRPKFPSLYHVSDSAIGKWVPLCCTLGSGVDLGLGKTYEKLSIKFSSILIGPNKFYGHSKKKFSEKLKISLKKTQNILKIKSLFLVIQNFFIDTSKKNSHKNRKFQWSTNNSKKFKIFLKFNCFLNYNHIKKSIWSKTGFA
ncbi:hypothetical protein AGLY_009852 [Aphis glycines]|uniref:Uncharacterized protein n=1 Tax=Aphis glycines TaxID=307491 RepID=A0A6G0TH39_APHGL|nr:hypothetical protein AGLY_009852 [Aphis glycines]